MAIHFNQQQSDGIRAAMKWWFNPHKKPVFVYSGYAGTGKSTCVNTLVQLLGINKYQVLYATLTGKASVVLRSKSCYSNTIHSVFYRVCVDQQTGQTYFARRKSINGCIKLIVIDEVSMVDGKMMEDIVSYGIPILALGDPGQLPPLFHPNPYVLHPDVMLTQVMRQDGESGILKLARYAREGKKLPYGKCLESEVIHIDQIKDIEKYDMVLCWSNKRRREINKIIRSKLGYDKLSRYPLNGEKLVCLKNDLENELIYQNDIIINPVNGMCCFTLGDAIDYDSTTDYIEMSYVPDFMKHTDMYFNSRVSKILFDSYYDDSVDPNNLFDICRDHVCLDFGYCITVHKSQGSSWPNVLVIDDYHGRHDQYPNWAYTALTRAEKSVTYAVDYKE
mgnify:CR=1 FL=1